MMHSARVVFSLTTVCLLVAFAQAGVVGKGGNKNTAVQPKLGDPKTAICRYMGPPVLDNYLGKRVPKITMMQLPSGKPLSLVLWATDEGKTPVWFEELVKNSKKGDVYEVNYAVADQNKQAVLDRMNEYTLKPGEEEENVFIFEDLKDEKDGTFKVSKFGASGELTLPQTRGSNKKMGPDETMLALLKDLKSGSSVELTMVGGKVKTLRKYERPRWGKFVKLSTKTVAGKELKAVEVDAYGNTLTLTMAPKDSAGFMGKFRRMKEGDLIIFRTATEKEVTWLAALTIPPKGSEIPPEPKEEDDDKKDDKKDKKDKDEKKDVKKDDKKVDKKDSKKTDD